MSKYTTELRFICEQLIGLKESVGYSEVDKVIEKARTKIFDFDYPIFDSAYKPVLETKIIRHFYTREIGAETYGRWKMFLQDRMNIIMPYYNQLYKSELLDFNPWYDVDITTTKTGSVDGKTTHDNSIDDNGTTTHSDSIEDDGRTTATNDEWNKYSDTPQGTVANLNNSSYLTDARNIVDNGSSTNKNTRTDKGSGTNKNSRTDKGNGTSKTTEEYLEKVKGKRNGMTYSKILMEYRDTFLNIDNMIIRELNDLFFNLW